MEKYEGLITIKDYIIVKEDPGMPAEVREHVESIISDGLASRPPTKYRGMYFVKTQPSGTGVIMVRNPQWWRPIEWFIDFLKRIKVIKED